MARAREREREIDRERERLSVSHLQGMICLKPLFPSSDVLEKQKRIKKIRTNNEKHKEDKDSAS